MGPRPSPWGTVLGNLTLHADIFDMAAEFPGPSARPPADGSRTVAYLAFGKGRVLRHATRAGPRTVAWKPLARAATTRA